jgi:DNA-binding CsgD family transcriptional regulator/tetratricopeptide (TPR) repeat protein
VLLEREAVLDSLRASLREACDGRGRVVLVSGEAGVGKSAAVRSFCDGARASARVLSGDCDPLFTPRPLGPFFDIAEEAGGELQAAVEEGPPEVVAALLRAPDPRSAAIVVVEDVHWADEATLDVLRLLARKLARAPLLVLATYRDEELDRVHPLRVVLGELATNPQVERLAVPPLSPEAVAALAEAAEVDPVELHRLTGGNPFFVTEVLASGNGAIPSTVRDAVLARAARLTTEARELLDAVAIAPPRVELWLLEALVSENITALNECLSSGMLVEQAGAIEFRHELARLAVEQSVEPRRRLSLHRTALASLARPPVGRPDLTRLAHHAEGAGDGEAVLQYAPAAAEQALSRGAFREAAAQYAHALRFADGEPPDKRAELLEGRSLACYLADDQVEAIAVVREAIACRRKAGSAAHEARALTELMDYLMCRGFYSEAEQAIAEATRLVADDPESPAAASVLVQRARLVRESDIGEAAELAQRAEEIAIRCGDLETAAAARVTIGLLELRRDVGLGRSMLERFVADSRESQVVQTARALNLLGAFGVQTGDHDLANTYLPAAFEHCVEHNLDLWRINVLASVALSQLDQGSWTEAAESAARLLKDPRESPWPQFEAFRILALVRARRGDPGANEAIHDALAVGLSREEVFAVVDMAATRAEIAWIERRPDEVDRVTASELEAALVRGATDDATRLSYWRRLAGLGATGLAFSPSGPYASCLTGDWREAADTWSRRGYPYETALALAEADEEEPLRQALEELRRLGARPAAAIVTRRLKQRGVRNVPRGPRPSTRRNEAQLTARELEVLRLLAEGLRNALIAERLFVSPRTVEHHVSAILAKLGVQSRGEAVAEAGRLGLLQDS